MENKIKWGVLSTAKIGLKKVIPAMQKGKYTFIHAIASRQLKKAEQAAKKLGIPKAYGSYEFTNGTATFTCATQLTPYQRVIIYGTGGRIEIEIPFNPPKDTQCKIILQKGDHGKEILTPACDQYTIQGDLFSQSILHDIDVPTQLDDAVANMKVIDCMFESAKNGKWIDI